MAVLCAVTSLLGEVSAVPTTVRERRGSLYQSLPDPAPGASRHWVLSGRPAFWEPFKRTTEPEGGLRDLSQLIPCPLGLGSQGRDTAPFWGYVSPLERNRMLTLAPLLSLTGKRNVLDLSGVEGPAVFPQHRKLREGTGGLSNAHKHRAGHRVCR